MYVTCHLLLSDVGKQKQQNQMTPSQRRVTGWLSIDGENGHECQENTKIGAQRLPSSRRPDIESNSLCERFTNYDFSSHFYLTTHGNGIHSATRKQDIHVAFWPINGTDSRASFHPKNSNHSMPSRRPWKWIQLTKMMISCSQSRSEVHSHWHITTHLESPTEASLPPLDKGVPDHRSLDKWGHLMKKQSSTLQIMF